MKIQSISICRLPITSYHFAFGSSTFVERSLQIHLFMQNEPNFRKSQMNVTDLLTMNYEKMDTWSSGKNEPKTNPNEPNFKKAKMKLTVSYTKGYENISNWAICENEPNSNPNEPKTNPTCRDVASGEGGSNPIYRGVAFGEAGNKLADAPVARQSQKHIKALIDCVSLGGLEFLSGWPAVYSGPLEGPKTRPILVHYVDRGFRANLLI